MNESHAEQRPGAPIIGPGKLAGAALNILMWPVVLLWLSGDWGWREGWIFSVWFVAFCTLTVAWLYRTDPALLAERYRKPGSGGQSRGDAMIVYAVTVGWLVWIVIQPLDAKRFNWSPAFPSWVKGVGGAMLLGASFFLFRAFKDNTFLSPLVRIQSERKHHVVTDGVYGIVRHPMYLGATLLVTGTPLLLGSIWGLGIGLGLALLLVLRISAEETLLARELEGYAAYRQKVRYRLLPRIW